MNGLGYILGDFFHKLVWSPCSEHSRGRCYDHIIQRFFPILAEKLALFLKTNVMMILLPKLAVF
jgi:hypothetical protein